MKSIVFYSWQSDLPNATNRGFIEAVLERAAARLTADKEISIEPVIDRDTQGVPGAPDIASTILSKIAAADMFVADVSLVVPSSAGRACPNPNVLIELGYALRAIGQERLILVFNTAYGRVEELPFDLRMRRVLTYNVPEKVQDRSAERKALEAKLEAAIRANLQHAPALPEDRAAVAIQAIETVAPNRIIVLRRELTRVLKEISDAEPKRTREGGSADGLMSALDQAKGPAADFAQVADTIALMNDRDAAIEVYKWLANLLGRYDLPQGFTGTFYESDFDYFRFLGHELFVSLFAFLLREGKWETVMRLLGKPIALTYVRREGRADSVSWTYASRPVLLLAEESRRKQRVSLHADVLNARHTSGELGKVLPFEEFVAADFFLFLKAVLQPDKTPSHLEWLP